MVRWTLLVVTTTLWTAQGLAQGVPVPRPFPGAGAPPATTSPRPPAEPAAPGPQPVAVVTARPGPELPGVPIYPTADFLETIPAGQGQEYHLYGTHASYRDIVNYYRTVLKTGGREVYRSPGVHQFDLGRFNESRMAYPPSVVVKDYADGTPAGYLFVSGTSETRYPTLIQIVPPGAE